MHKSFRSSLPDSAGERVIRVDFDSVADIYENTRGVPAPFMQYIVEDMLKTLEPGEDSLALDLGCGTGRISREFVERGVRTVGVDISQQMLGVACERQQTTSHWRNHLVSADAVALPFLNGLFHAIIAIHLFHLFPDWQNSLLEVQRLLQPSGILITGFIESPMRASRLSNLFEQQRVELGYPPVRFGATGEEVIVALEEMGGTVESREFHTIAHISYHQTLESFEQRVFSSTWENLPDVVHRQIMQELRRFVNSEFRSPSLIEPVKIKARMNYIRFG